MTDVAVEGLRRGHVESACNQVTQLIEDGVLTGGMLPKLKCAVDAMDGGG